MTVGREAYDDDMVQIGPFVGSTAFVDLPYDLDDDEITALRREREAREKKRRPVGFYHPDLPLPKPPRRKPRRRRPA